jgi:2-keto-4-pentenoate hydratase/2-oxohepta-3-ene-1,7-dioic acid hydratase in catechol pathway
MPVVPSDGTVACPGSAILPEASMVARPALVGVLLALISVMNTSAQDQVTRYVRYAHQGRIAYGLLEGDAIRELGGNIFEGATPTGRTVKAAEAKLLAPCEPSKVIAVGLNYKSHLGERPAATYPGLFLKLPTSIVGPDDEIVFPAGAENVHYEGELVVVIGRRARNIAASDAPAHIFGVTAGNDVSERNWQRADLQWFRAKASDTFGPLGPAIVRGLNYNDLLVQTRLNGEVRQSQRTRDLIFGIDDIVSYVSGFVTLLPGDVIYTGTPGTTQAMKPGDVVEIEVEGVGVLQNRIAATTSRR